MEELSDEAIQQLYGRWQRFTPREVAQLFDRAPFPWWVAGGWAAEASGAPPREHADIDVVVLLDDLAAIRSWLSNFISGKRTQARCDRSCPVTSCGPSGEGCGCDATRTTRGSVICSWRVRRPADGCQARRSQIASTR